MAKKKDKISTKAQQEMWRDPGEERLTSEEIAEKRIAEWNNNPFEEDAARRQDFLKRFDSKTRALDLFGLALKKIPESIRELKNVEIIDLGRNKIEEVPEWIEELKELKSISLDKNLLQKLPQQIVTLYKLNTLWLQRNNLEILPEGLQNLPIKEIRLKGNPGLGLPESILERSPQEILRYYFESRAGDGQLLLELKLLLVGRGKAGKTSLVKQLAGEQPDDNEPETHSIAIREFMLDCPKGQVRTRAWDFGGQEILHSTHQFFLTERCLYLLVLEPRTNQAQKDAEYWLKLIESQGGGSPVIVALNYSGDRNWRVDEVKLRRKFPFIVDFISTDAMKGYGIEQLRQTMIKTVQDAMPGVWLSFPKHWRSIKNEVAGMRNNFLTYEEYVTLCKKFGERRLDAQADLAGILHALGLVLYFGRDLRLHDTRVLNPGWVTGGVYAVIRSRYVEERNGQLSLADMLIVLKEAEDKQMINIANYPPETHQFILGLMRAFQLCYSSEKESNRPARYLVPELLPEFEPEMTEPWHEAPVRLRYRYNVLPPGLLSRFIVQTHELSEDAPHWRHGVVLKHSDAQALIRDEPDGSELHVFILGEDKEVRGFLVAMVREQLKMLHAAMRIQPTEELELTGENDQWIDVKALRDIEQPDQSRQKLKLPVQPEGTAEVDIPLELDKLIPSEARAIDRDQSKIPIPVRVFVSYAREDERQLKRLDAILNVLEEQHGLTSWRDQRLVAGVEWDEEIHHRLEGMDIFLFIASQASLVSPYIQDIELKRAIERMKEKQVEIVTVLLEPCAYDDHPVLGKLQRLASKYKSVAEAPLKSTVWEQVRKDLLPVIQRVRDKKAQP